MPNFSFAPPDPTAGPHLHLRRTPAAGKLIAIVTCDRLIGCPTHWFGNRTIPCEPPDCPACNKGHPWRWHGYLTAVNSKTNEHFLFEMTAQAAEPFTAYHTQYDTLRGCLFEASRVGNHHNGRVTIRCKPADLNKVHLPNPPDLVACLCHVWNVPTPEATIDDQLKQNDHIIINRKPDGNNEPAQQIMSRT